MDIRKSFKDIIEKTQVIMVPKHRIATFGYTRMKYYFVSQVPQMPDRSRVREGLVIAESPKIITPESLKDRFEGFGQDSEDFGRYLSDHYGPNFRGLQYKFKNEFHSGKIEYLSLSELTENVGKDLIKNDSQQSVLIQGPDATWQISLMKFIVDECMRSFAGNIRDLDEHGYFATREDLEMEKRKEIERLFMLAKIDRSKVRSLGEKLRELGIFKEYEERFFRLLKSER